MPRLSLYKPFKGNDYTFMDHSIREQFDIGGTGIHVHKYLDPIHKKVIQTQASLTTAVD